MIKEVLDRVGNALLAVVSAIVFVVGIVLVIALVQLVVTTIASAATVHAQAARNSDTELAVTLDVTVRHGTSLFMEGCADIQGGLACGGGKAKKVQLHRGHQKLEVPVSNKVQTYTPPPLGTTAAWDAWKYMPGKTDSVFLWFRGKALLEVKPTALAVDTLTQ